MELTSASLHILAMFFMLLDHMWATVVPGNEWMTCVGRLAFPIFAFLLVEGFFHTRSRKKYALRLLIFALVTEIPFNLMAGGRFFFPIHQNVLWTFLLSFGLMAWNERLEAAPLWRKFLRWVAAFWAGMILGTLTMVDYYGYGAAMVLAFYLIRKNWWNRGQWLNRLMQIFAMYWINVEMMGGLVYEFEALGRIWVIHQQGFAVLALIPIWLYKGKKGHSSKAFQYFCYGFYPVHMLILALLR
jgi:hypothetical protein